MAGKRPVPGVSGRRACRSRSAAWAAACCGVGGAGAGSAPAARPDIHIKPIIATSVECFMIPPFSSAPGGSHASPEAAYLAPGVVLDAALVVEDHRCAPLRIVGGPVRQPRMIRVTTTCEGHPGIARARRQGSGRRKTRHLRWDAGVVEDERNLDRVRREEPAALR